MGFFERYLSLWVLACMAVGVAIGVYIPEVPALLGQWEYAHVSIPVAILIWLMIYPMMLKVDFASIVQVGKNPKGLVVTWVTNWLIKPFTMFAIAYVFFYQIFSHWIPADMAKDYIAGAVLLGAAPCTAMVFVWSHLTKGNPAYTLVQVATNDLIILIAFVPIVALLLGVTGVTVPWDTLFLSVVLFVVIPLGAGWLTRMWVVKQKGLSYFENNFIPKFSNITVAGLLLTLVIIFSFQGKVILDQPFNIALIAIPLILQTVFIFFIAFYAAKAWKLPFDVAAPAGLIGASNFFELAVAVAIALFGLQSGATLVTVVGVLVEVPVMLALVRWANKHRYTLAHSADSPLSDSVDSESMEPALANASEPEFDKTRVLVLCTGNSCRSQITEGFLKKYGGDRFEVRSAGLTPRPVHPLTFQVMEESGLDTDDIFTKSISHEIGKGKWDHIIFVCSVAEENCPSVFIDGPKRHSWPFEDPAAFEGQSPEMVLEKFREVRDQIDSKVKAWIGSL